MSNTTQSNPAEATGIDLQREETAKASETIFDPTATATDAPELTPGQATADVVGDVLGI